MCTPVWDVSAANHRGQIGDRVASHTDFVEPGVLANQMTAQETTMGAPRDYYLLRVELATFQNTFNSKLVGRKKNGGDERKTHGDEQISGSGEQKRKGKNSI